MDAATNQHTDPFRHTCLIPYVDPATAAPEVAEKINVLPFRRNIFLLLGHSRGLFPHLMGVIGGCFNGNVRTVQLLDWVGLPLPCPRSCAQNPPVFFFFFFFFQQGSDM